jgi:hypothetical protein
MRRMTSETAMPVSASFNAQAIYSSAYLNFFTNVLLAQRAITTLTHTPPAGRKVGEVRLPLRFPPPLQESCPCLAKRCHILAHPRFVCFQHSTTHLTVRDLRNILANFALTGSADADF